MPLDAAAACPHQQRQTLWSSVSWQQSLRREETYQYRTEGRSASLPQVPNSVIAIKTYGGGRFDEAIGSTQNRMGKTQPWASVFPCPLFLSVAVINYLVSSMASEEVFVTQQECSGFFKVAWLQVKGSSVSPTVPWAATHLNTGPSGPSVWLKEAKGDGWLALSVFSLCC